MVTEPGAIACFDFVCSCSWTSFAVRYAPVKTPDFGAGANTDNMRYDQLYCRHDRLCEAANPGCPLFAAIGES
jgi:hypothetical protein